MSQFYVEENEEEEEVFKVIVIGDSNVGKSCLAHRFCKGTFPERTEATIGVDFWEKRLTIGQTKIRLQLWDTAGQERFRKSMVGHYYRNVSAVVFMYDVTREGSFQALAMWLQEYSHFGYTPSGQAQVPKILIGNKCDLTDERRVGSNVARKFADQHDMPLWEISTKNDEELETINSIFLTLAHKLVKHKPLMDQNSLYMSMGHYGEETPSRTIQREQGSTRRIRLKLRGSSVNREHKKACCTESA